jgi:chromosome segregation ATPase
MKNKDAELVKKEEEMKKMKAEFDEALAATKNEVEIIVAELQTALTDKQTELDTVKAELNAANEVIAAYKDKEAEMMKKEKMMKRKAALVEAGLDEESVASTLEKFENIDDTAFETMTSLFAGMKVKKAEMMMETPKKKPAKAEDVVDALEEVETTETVELGVGGEAESTVSNTRAELVEFVCARLGKNLNKGE